MIRSTASRPLAFLMALALALGACSGDGAEDGPATPTASADEAAAAPPPAPATPTAEPVAPEGSAEPAPGETVGDVVVEGDGFAITFPSQPSVERVDVPLEDGLSTEATIYQAQVGTAFLGFSHADTPDTGETLEFDEEEALRDSAQGAADNTGGEVALAEIIDFQGRTAIDYLVTVPGGALRGIAFFDDLRLYTGQLVAVGSDVDRAPLDEMMGSLAIR